MAKRIVGDDRARLLSKVAKTESCWLWMAAKNGHGYGNFYLAGKYMGAHRAAYLLLVGPIPDGMEIDHLCRVKDCVNPAHLEPVTHRINDLRGLGVSAWNAVKTHCVKGHPFDEANTYYRPGRFGRMCRRCRNEAAERSRRRAAAAAA